MTTPSQDICGRLVAVSIAPPAMTECGLAPGHSGECVPYEHPRPKRKVSYNQDAVLCPVCKKRIRLNNSGRLRVHVSGRVGSEHCTGSNAEPLTTTSISVPRKSPSLFSDTE